MLDSFESAPSIYDQMMSRKKIESDKAILDHRKDLSIINKNDGHCITHVDENMTNLEFKITETLKIKQSLLKEKIEHSHEPDQAHLDKVPEKLFLKEVDLKGAKYNFLLANRRFERQNFVAEKFFFEKQISKLDFLDITEYFGFLVLKNLKKNEHFSFPVVIYEIPVSMKYYLFSENGSAKICGFLNGLQNNFDGFFEIYSAHYLVPPVESDKGGSIFIAQE